MIRRHSTQVINQMEFMHILYTDQRVHYLFHQNMEVVHLAVELLLILQWRLSKEDRSNNYHLIVMFKIPALWEISSFL